MADQQPLGTRDANGLRTRASFIAVRALESPPPPEPRRVRSSSTLGLVEWVRSVRAVAGSARGCGRLFPTWRITKRGPGVANRWSSRIDAHHTQALWMLSRVIHPVLKNAIPLTFKDRQCPFIEWLHCLLEGRTGVPMSPAVRPKFTPILARQLKRLSEGFRQLGCTQLLKATGGLCRQRRVMPIPKMPAQVVQGERHVKLVGGRHRSESDR